MAHRVISLALGLVVGVGLSAVLTLALRQQVAGLPPVRATAPGLAVGSTVIPWAEIDEVGAVSLFALPHVAIVQSPATPKRLRGIRSLQYMPIGDQRGLFLSERQLGTTVEAGVQQIREVWSRTRRVPNDT